MIAGKTRHGRFNNMALRHLLHHRTGHKNIVYSKRWVSYCEALLKLRWRTTNRVRVNVAVSQNVRDYQSRNSAAIIFDALLFA